MNKNKYLLYFLRDKVILVYSVDILFKYQPNNMYPTEVIITITQKTQKRIK